MLTREEMEQAACTGMDTNIFYSGMSGRYANEMTAKAVCVTCPIRMQCLQQALENDEYGIWGGTTEIERAAMRRRQRRTQSIFISNMSPAEIAAKREEERKTAKLRESNERRAMAASLALKEALAKAKEVHGDALPKQVITMVEWKIANPAMSYSDLGKLMTPVMTKDKAAGLVRRWIKGIK